MHGGPPSEVVRHLYYYNTLEPGVQSTAPDDIHHHHPLPAAALVAMDPTGGRGGDSRYNLNYSMSIGLNMTEGGGGGGVQDMYGNPTSSSLVRPGMSMNNSRSLMAPNNNNNNNNTSQSSVCLPNNSTGGGTSGGQRGIKRTNSDCFDDRAMGSSQQQQQQQQQQQLGSMDGCGPVGGAGSGGVPDVVDESYAALQKKSPPANGKKTKGRVKIKMEYIDNKLRRYTTFSKRKTGIMKKAYELSTLTGTQVMLLVASETGHVYTFATRKLQPMITSEAGKQLIQTCLNSPDPPSGATTGDQRMSATGFEETELSYNIADEDSKDDRSPMSSGESGDESSGLDSPGPSGTASANNIQHTSNTIEAQHNSSTAAIGATVRHPPGPTHSQQQQQHHHGMQAMSQHHGHIQQQQQQPPHHQPVDGEANKGQMNNPANSVIYPAAALANVPQDVLLSLVQAGHLQVHQEENGAQQYITIPLSMMSGGVLGKMAIKDPTIVGGSSSHGVASNMATSTPSATSVHRGGVSANGRDSPSLTPMELIIKKENIE